MSSFSSTGRPAPEPSPMPAADPFGMPCTSIPVRIVPLGTRPDGSRLITQPGSGLVVGIAPVDDVAGLLAHRSFRGGGGYVTLSHGNLGFTSAQIRPGDTSDLPRRLREHLLWPPHRIEYILVVGPADPAVNPFGKDAALTLQWILHGLALRAGRATVVGAAAPRPLLLDSDPALVGRWIADLRPLLVAAGVMLFEPQGAVTEPRASAPSGNDDRDDGLRPVERGYAITLPARLTERPDALRYRLAWNSLSGQATVTDGWTVLHAGSLADPAHRPGIQACIATKRDRLLEHGVLQRTAGGLLRLTRDIAVPSLLNATRLLTGTNEAISLFRPVV